jgi:hypothetical protein
MKTGPVEIDLTGPDGKINTFDRDVFIIFII